MSQQNDMKSRKSTKWDNFKSNVIKYIKEKGIASMQEVYDISNQYLHMVYATSHFEKLASFLVTNCGCFRIDLSIPNPKPLAIYPNHHKIKSTTFFVLEETDDNHFADVERAKSILKDLTEKALEAENEKKKAKSVKKSKSSKIDLEPSEKDEKMSKYRENQFRARDCMLNGFIPMISVQMQMIHLFVFDTFGSQPFTIQQFVDKMSLDFMSKIVGIKHIPDVLLKDIRFRHILVSCLPKRIQDQIQLSEAPQILSQNFKRISDFTFGRFGRQFLTKVNDDTYQLIDSIKIKFLGQFEIKYNFVSQDQVNEFHFMLQIIDLLENIDPHSYSLWLKRYSTDSIYRDDPTYITRKIIDTFVTFPYNKTFPFFYPQVEKFVAKYGQNWCNLKSTLQEFFQKDENKLSVLMQCMYPSGGPIDDFCNGRPLEPKPFTLFSKITSKDFELPKSDTGENNYYDTNLFFNYLSAIMKLFPSGLITSMNDMWDKAMPIFTELTGVEAEDFLHGNTPEALHFILRSKFAEYRDLCTFSTANESIKIRKFDQKELLSLLQNYEQKKKNEIDDLRSSSSISQAELKYEIKTIRKQYMLKSEIFELTTSDYLDRFSTNKLRYALSRPTAEMVERLKILSITPLDSISIKYAKIFLSEIEDIETNGNELLKNDENDDDYVDSTVTNGVLFLKLSNFYSERFNKFKSNNIFYKNGLNCELYTITPSITYKDIIYFFNILQKKPYEFSSRAEINCGSMSFFLDYNIPIQLDLEFRGGIKSKRKQKKNNFDSDSDNEFETNFDDDNDDDDYSNDIVIDSSYLIGKLSNFDDRRISTKKASNMTSIVKQLRFYDSVSVKLKGLLLPTLISSNDNDNASTVEIAAPPKRGRGRAGRGKRRVQPNNQRKSDDENKKSDNESIKFEVSNDLISKLESNMCLCSNFTNYPSDSSNALYDSFMQLFVVICQVWNGPDPQKFVLICRLLYAFIDHKFSVGASLESILDEFATFDIAYIFSGIDFLEQFKFIYKLNIDTAMPHFLSDSFAKSRLIKVKCERKDEKQDENKSKKIVVKKKKVKRSKKNKSDDGGFIDDYLESDDDDNENENSSPENMNEKEDANENSSECIAPHIWINANGVLDWKLMHRIMRKIVEIVEFEPGIEFTQLAGRLPSITPNDIFALVDALEYDEVIYSIFLIDDDPDCDEFEKPLFVDEVKSMMSPPVDCTMYMYNLAVNMKNPLLKPAVKRRIFPTERSKFNLALVVEDESVF